MKSLMPISTTHPATIRVLRAGLLILAAVGCLQFDPADRLNFDARSNESDRFALSERGHGPLESPALQSKLDPTTFNPFALRATPPTISGPDRVSGCDRPFSHSGQQALPSSNYAGHCRLCIAICLLSI